MPQTQAHPTNTLPPPVDTSAQPTMDSSTSPPTTGTDKLAGLVTMMGNNAVTLAAPGMSHNELGIGGLAVNSIAMAVNAIVQQLKAHDGFKQDKYAIVLGGAIILGLCIAIWVQEDWRKAILNACDGLSLFLTNYGPMKNVKILPTAKQMGSTT